MKRVPQTFRYVPAVATDIRKTFARVKREQAEAKAAKPLAQRLRKVGG